MEDMREILSRLAKKYDEVVDIVYGNSVADRKFGYFGIYGIDRITGGYPFGKIILLWGNASTCKTTTCIRAASEAQKTCRFCLQPFFKCECDTKERFRIAYVDAEDKFDPLWFKIQGLDIDKDDFILIKPTGGLEKTGDVLRELVEEGIVDLVIIDTWENLAPKKEMDESVLDYNIGLKARQGNKFLRLWVVSVQRCISRFGIAPTLFVVNQKRQNINSFFGSDIKPGGLALSFAPSLSLKYFGRSETKDTSTKEVKKISFSVWVEKSKICPEGRICSFDMFIKKNQYHDLGDTDDILLLL